MLVFQNEHIIVEMNKEISSLVFKWISSNHIPNHTFKDVIMQEVKLIEQYKPKSILIDTQKFAHSISPEMQDWINMVFTEKLIDLGINKLAFVLGKDENTRHDIEQTMEEAHSGILPIKYYDEYSKALNWIKE